MKTDNAFTLSRLVHALNNDLSIAYPILARFGYMETTVNGFKAIDPEAIQNRIKQLIAQLQLAKGGE